jgi:hypothetical protein
LLSGCEHKNSWQLSEWLGASRPDGVQRLLEQASWDAEVVRNELRRYVIEQLADSESVLIESLCMQLRKELKNRGHFPSDEATTKLIFLALRDITKR